MAMSKSCYNGCYNRRSCYNHGCCNQQSSGVSTGSLLAAGVAASLLVLALDCDDTTTTTTTTCTATAAVLDDPFAYLLPGIASTDKTALQQLSARQPLGLFGYPATAAPRTTPNPVAFTAVSAVITYGFTPGNGATTATVFSAAASTVGVKNVPTITPITTAANLINAYQISVNLTPFFAAVLADTSNATLTVTNVSAFLSAAGYTNTTDIVYSVDVQIQGLDRFYEAVGATGGNAGAAPYATQAMGFPHLSGALTLGTAANIAGLVATYGTTGFDGVNNLYDTTSAITATTQTGKVSLFQTSARYTTSLMTYAGITVPTQASYSSVPVSLNGLDSAYSVRFTVADITGAIATGTTAYAVRFLAWRSTYTPQVLTLNAALTSTSTTALTILQNSTTAAATQTQAQAATNNLGLPGILANVGVLLQYAFSYTFKPATRGFFVRTGTTTNSVYTYSNGATTQSQSGGAQANNPVQDSLTTGRDLQCLAIVEIGSGVTA
jgi:hypothetical protein